MRTTAEKITTREELAPKVAAWRQQGKIVGFTSGSFDIIHAGHASYLEAAKGKCDILVVGINTDESVRSYKGPERPISSEDARVKAIAALESVDYVFLFGERRNRQNLEILKPSLYIKAGDYAEKELTSATVVKKYGGDVLLLPLEEGISTSGLIEKIAKIFGGKGTDEAVHAKNEERSQQKAILVDRDGTINEDIEYLHEPEKLKLLPNVGEGLKKFQDMGYKIAIITLQGGIGLGYFTKEDFFKTNSAMLRALAPYGIRVDKIYYAPHSKPEDDRNPKDELIERAREELDLDLSESVVVGDTSVDIGAGNTYGCITIGVKTGKGLRDGRYETTPAYLAVDLLDAANWVEANI